MLESLITSKTRLNLLVKFFISEANKGHLRGLAEEFNESTNSIRKELNQLTDAGYLFREANQNKVTYSANTTHPLFKTLKQLIHKYIGFDTIVENILAKLGNVGSIYLVGDIAQGINSNTIEVLITGEGVNEAYLLQLGTKIEKLLDRKVILHLNKESSFDKIIEIYKN